MFVTIECPLLCKTCRSQHCDQNIFSHKIGVLGHAVKDALVVGQQRRRGVVLGHFSFVQDENSVVICGEKHKNALRHMTYRSSLETVGNLLVINKLTQDGVETVGDSDDGGVGELVSNGVLQ